VAKVRSRSQTVERTLAAMALAGDARTFYDPARINVSRLRADDDRDYICDYILENFDGSDVSACVWNVEQPSRMLEHSNPVFVKKENRFPFFFTKKRKENDCRELSISSGGFWTFGCGLREMSCAMRDKSERDRVGI